MSTAPVTTAVGPSPGAALLTLHAAVPNPASSSTLLRFALARAARAELSVYDVRGRRIRTLVERDLAAGPHEARWDGRDGNGRAQGAGIYFYRLSTAEGAVTRRLTLLR
jgi:flagellar hook assembly protein FlgD